jgi:hypothetical protein
MNDVEIDEVCRSKNIEKTKNTFCLNFCFSMTVYMIRVSEYSTSSKINWRFYFIYAFSSVEIDVEIDKVHRSEDFDGMKYAPCLNSSSSITIYMIKTYNYSVSSEINCHFCFMYIDKICRSEDSDGMKNASCLNFCLSMTVYMIGVSDYSA